MTPTEFLTARFALVVDYETLLNEDFGIPPISLSFADRLLVMESCEVKNGYLGSCNSDFICIDVRDEPRGNGKWYVTPKMLKLVKEEELTNEMIQNMIKHRNLKGW